LMFSWIPSRLSSNFLLSNVVLQVNKFIATLNTSGKFSTQLSRHFSWWIFNGRWVLVVYTDLKSFRAHLS
jgi:hypothetical protein